MTTPSVPPSPAHPELEALVGRLRRSIKLQREPRMGGAPTSGSFAFADVEALLDALSPAPPSAEAASPAPPAEPPTESQLRTAKAHQAALLARANDATLAVVTVWPFLMDAEAALLATCQGRTDVWPLSDAIEKAMAAVTPFLEAWTDVFMDEEPPAPASPAPPSPGPGEAERLREALADVLVRHWPTQSSGCKCGGVPLGASYPAHIADLTVASLRPAVAAKVCKCRRGRWSALCDVHLNPPLRSTRGLWPSPWAPDQAPPRPEEADPVHLSGRIVVRDAPVEFINDGFAAPEDPS